MNVADRVMGDVVVVVDVVCVVCVCKAYTDFFFWWIAFINKYNIIKKVF